MKLLDLAKFRKTAEDKNTATMKHDDGHTMTILIKALPAIHREQLKRIPLHAEEKMAAGGKVKHLADGTPPGSLDIEQVQPGDPDAQNPTPSATQESSPQQAPIVDDITQPDMGNPPTQIEQSQLMQAPLHQKIPDIVAALQSNTTQLQAAQKQRQDAYINLNKMVGDTVGAANAGVINPNHWAESQTGDQKVGTAIGLMLGGLGGGLLGTGGNVALDYMNKQIDRDIQSQKDTFHNKATIFGAYQHIFNDSQTAEEATRATQNAIMANRIQQAVYQNGTPMAAQRGAPLAQYYQGQSQQHTMNAVNLLQNKQSGGQTSSGPGSQVPSQVMGQPGDQTIQPQPQTGILNPQAAKIYQDMQQDTMLPEYMRKSPEQKAAIASQFHDAQMVDKALPEVNGLMDEVYNKSTKGGWLAEHIDPNMVGGALAAGAEGLGAIGTIPTAGASLLGAVPGALLAGGAGKILGSGAKALAEGAGGQQEIQHGAARKNLVTAIAKLLGKVDVTPSEKEAIASQYIPTIRDDRDTVEYKKQMLREKAFLANPTDAIEGAGMTNNLKLR